MTQVNLVTATRSKEVVVTVSCDRSMQELGVTNDTHTRTHTHTHTHTHPQDVADEDRSKHMRRLLEDHEYVCCRVIERRSLEMGKEATSGSTESRRGEVVV